MTEPKDIHHAIVLNAADEDDEVDATGRAAEASPVPNVRAGSQAVVREIVAEGLRVAAARLGQQRSVVRQNVDRTSKMLAKEDPTAVKAVSNAEIAEERARKIKGGG